MGNRMTICEMMLSIYIPSQHSPKNWVQGTLFQKSNYPNIETDIMLQVENLQLNEYIHP